ncbi:Zinc finger C2H2-type protein [Lasiodiplodia theobromae]|uniref:Zinc finger protein 58 n=1 Tax=Lasiodiplodia theobromae TaxID=45133 RepID=A0A5N5DCA2_9PEZI|nr:Zinc finger protein [Lasiodiplodia theobromae]KAB2575050.1 Zinc finger protein 58 [Lasiodiplodia theobromae]KAF4540542.1 Zinc finger protein [Lasiodiplodia theobromae]KAF9640258.1 Zinc finger C2H2-type protein [Lasiodiplodia theobromae]
MAQLQQDELMADFIPLDSGDVPDEMRIQHQSAKDHFHEMHPEIEMMEHKCVCGRYFKELKNMRSHQKATGHGACVCGENFSSYPELHRHRFEAVHFVRCTCDKIFGSTQHLLSHQRLESHSGYRDTKKGSLKWTAIESNTLNEVLCPCGGQILDSQDGSSEEPLQCDACSRVFRDAYGPARDTYDPSTSIFSCCNCGLEYDTWDEMWQHQLFIHHPCIACHRIFVCETRLMAHQRATSHCYCAACTQHFMTPDRLRQHLLEDHHLPRATVFQDALDERPLSDPSSAAAAPVFKGGFKSGKNFLHISLRCRVCGSDFTSPKTLHDHRTRGWHDPFTSVACPFAACEASEKSFPSVSALLHHLETAQCGSGITLAELNDALRGPARLEACVLPEHRFRPTPRDPCAGGALSDREIQALCEQVVASSSAEGEGGGGVVGDASSSNKKLKLKCPFCPASAWKTFPTKAQLKAHLTHYNHTPRFLQFPDSVVLPPTKSKRKTDFGAWSGLAHSLETLLCAGEVEGVQAALDVIEDALAELGKMANGAEAGGMGEEADMVVD